MTTRAQVTELLNVGHSYEAVARELGISAGLAFMIATGVPADGSGAPPAPEEHEGRQMLPSSPQTLVNSAAPDPVRDRGVVDWVRRRAARELTQPS